VKSEVDISVRKIKEVLHVSGAFSFFIHEVIEYRRCRNA